MLRPKGRPSAKEVAQGFLISLASEEELIDIEKALIEKYGIDENKYRWEARYQSWPQKTGQADKW